MLYNFLKETRRFHFKHQMKTWAVSYAEVQDLLASPEPWRPGTQGGGWPTGQHAGQRSTRDRLPDETSKEGSLAPGWPWAAGSM